MRVNTYQSIGKGHPSLWYVLKRSVVSLQSVYISPSMERYHDEWTDYIDYGGFEPAELLCGDLGDLTPSRASCSKKSDQRSAKDSLLVPLSGKKSVDKAGVLGVRCHGETGTLALGFEAPGRARPACSLCSVRSQYYKACSDANKRTLCPGQ